MDSLANRFHFRFLSICLIRFFLLLLGNVPADCNRQIIFICTPTFAPRQLIYLPACICAISFVAASWLTLHCLGAFGEPMVRLAPLDQDCYLRLSRQCTHTQFKAKPNIDFISQAKARTILFVEWNAYLCSTLGLHVCTCLPLCFYRTRTWPFF